VAGNRWTAILQTPRASIVLVVIAIAADIMLFVRPHTAGDVGLYHLYAQDFWFGSPPFHLLPAEYPALALVIFTLTLIPPVLDYATVFAIWMGLAVAVGLWAIHRVEGRRAAVAAGAYLAIGAFGTVLARFDIVPSLVGLAALWLAYRRRWDAASVLLAIGFLLKLYPVIWLPLLVIDQWRTQGRLSWRPIVMFGVIATSGMFVAAALSPTGWLSPFEYALVRPPQVESIEASALWLASGFGVAAHAAQSFHSRNIVSVLAEPFSMIAMTIMVVGVAWIYLRHMQGRLSLHRAALASLLLVVLTNKVLSPQYLIWFLPLVAIVEGLNWRWVVICVLTSVIYPFLYLLNLLSVGAPNGGFYGPLFAGTIAVRNGLLIYALIRVVRPGASRLRIIEPESTRNSGAVAVRVSDRDASARGA
jgi:hypothetical protein